MHAQVLQGILSGQQNSTTLVAILSAPIWNATAETLTFGMRPVTSEAALKLRDGVANGAFAAGRNESLSSNAVGVVLRDVVVYVDDSSARKASGMEVSARAVGALVLMPSALFLLSLGLAIVQCCAYASIRCMRQLPIICCQLSEDHYGSLHELRSSCLSG